MGLLEVCFFNFYFYFFVEIFSHFGKLEKVIDFAMCMLSKEGISFRFGNGDSSTSEIFKEENENVVHFAIDCYLVVLSIVTIVYCLHMK